MDIKKIIEGAEDIRCHGDVEFTYGYRVFRIDIGYVPDKILGFIKISVPKLFLYYKGNKLNIPTEKVSELRKGLIEKNQIRIDNLKKAWKEEGEKALME